MTRLRLRCPLALAGVPLATPAAGQGDAGRRETVRVESTRGGVAEREVRRQARNR